MSTKQKATKARFSSVFLFIWVVLGAKSAAGSDKGECKSVAQWNFRQFVCVGVGVWPNKKTIDKSLFFLVSFWRFSDERLVAAVVGSNISLACNVSGAVSWLKDDVNITKVDKRLVAR